MKPLVKKYYELLFNSDEKICFSTSAFHNQILSRNSIQNVSQYEYLCINPINGGRKASDIATYRNFLIEIDCLDLRKQLEYIINLKVPYSTLVYSGKKSFHYIISLVDNLDCVEKYDFLSTWVHNIISKADHATRNATRLSRVPNVIRKNTGKMQTLAKVRDRIKSEDLLQWLNKFPDKIPQKQTHQVTKSHNRAQLIDNIEWYISHYLKCSYDPSGIHIQCPVCSKEGHDRHRDNLYVSGHQRNFHCFARKEHDKLIYREILRLRNQSQ